MLCLDSLQNLTVLFQNASDDSSKVGMEEWDPGDFFELKFSSTPIFAMRFLSWFFIYVNSALFFNSC